MTSQQKDASRVTSPHVLSGAEGDIEGGLYHFPHSWWVLYLPVNQKLLESNDTFYESGKKQAYPPEAKGECDPWEQTGVLITKMSPPCL